MWLKNRILAPGPTPLPEESRQAQARRQIYHRTADFAAVIEAVNSALQDLLAVDWPVVPVAASGTGGMQMAAQNLVEPGEKVLAVDSGKFGRRWSRILEQLGCDVATCEVERGRPLSTQKLSSFLDRHPEAETVFLTLVETSTLVRHPVEELSELISERDKLVVVDAISGLGAEPFYPAEHGVDVVVGGSQKGLMAPPGLAVLAAGPAAVARAAEISPPDRYFDLQLAVDRLREENQTPWTPPMGLLRALRASLDQLFDEGLRTVFNRHRRLANICRSAVRAGKLELFATAPAVSGTAVKLPESVDGEALHDFMYENCKLYIPGGQQELAGRIIRIGHLGFVDYFDLLNGLSALELGLRNQNFELEPGVMLGAAQRKLEQSKG